MFRLGEGYGHFRKLTLRGAPEPEALAEQDLEFRLAPQAQMAFLSPPFGSVAD